MARLSTIYPPPRMTDIEAEQRMTLYVDLLEDIPLDILADAFRKCAQTCKFFPTVAEIRSAAQRALSERAWTTFVLRQVVRIHQEKWKPPIEPADRPSREEVEAMLEGIERELVARDRPGAGSGRRKPSGGAPAGKPNCA